MAEIAITEAVTKTRRSGLHLPGLVVRNAAALYAVQAGRKLIPLAWIPYLARVLGPEGWGKVAFVTALAELIVILIEFGFTLSATRAIARHRDDPSQRGRIATGVLCAQAMLAVLGIAAALVAARFIPLLRGDQPLLAAGLVYAIAQGFIPLWYFQGMERIRLAAALELAAKTAALGALFIFVHKPGDAWRALAIQALSPAVSVLVGVWLALSTSRACRPEWEAIRSILREGGHMFALRSTESLYGVANAFLLGLYTGPVLVGYFVAAEKVSKAMAGLVNPIRESLYPRISHLVHHDAAEAARLAKVGTGIMIGLGTLLSAGLFLFAEPIVLILMGGRFEPAVGVLKILSPLPLLLSMTFASGQLWLLPLGRDRTVLRVVCAAALLNLSLSFVFAPRWGHIGMASAVLVAESFVAASLFTSAVRLRTPLHSTEAATLSCRIK